MWRIILTFLVLLTYNTATQSLAQEAQAATQGLPLETFERYPAQTFPTEWKVRGDEEQARTIYRISEENGNHFLHARAEQQAVQIGLEQEFQPTQLPLLRWRWRVQQLPPGGDERHKETNDSAAGIYVIFDNRLLPRVIKYVWSATLPVGTRFQSPSYIRMKTVVLETGTNGIGEWREEKVNVYEDYKALFGEEPGTGQGIGLLTGSKSTQSLAIADYDDFALLPATGQAAGESLKTSKTEEKR